MSYRRLVHRIKRFLTRYKWASIAMAAGVLIIIAALIPWGGGNDSDKANSDSASATPTLPSDSNDQADDGVPTPKPTAPASTALGSLPGFKVGANDTHPYAFSIGDTKVHTVTLTISTDGKAYLGYQFRYGQAHKVLTGSTFSITKHLHGPSPIAQVAGQVVGNATYTTCAIYIDGKKAISHTVEGLNNIAFCGA